MFRFEHVEQPMDFSDRNEIDDVVDEVMRRQLYDRLRTAAAG